MPQQVHRDRPAVTAEHGQVRRPGGAAAGEPVQQQQRAPGTFDADRVADAIGHGQPWSRNGPHRDILDQAMQHDVPCSVGTQTQDPNTRTRHRRGHGLTDPTGLELGGLRAEDPRHGQDVDAVGCPEQLLEVLG